MARLTKIAFLAAFLFVLAPVLQQAADASESGVYSFGQNWYGQLGHGDTDSGLKSYTPARIAGLEGSPRAVAAGNGHSLVILENGDVFSFGSNTVGQLGHGDTKDRHTPSRINGLGPAKAAAAYNHSIILLENGDVYTFGQNHSGQLGHGDTKDRNTPTKINGLGPAKAVAAGYNFSLVVLENGDVYSFGANLYGQLGHGELADRHTPTKIGGLNNAKAVAASTAHSLVLLENGDVYSFGLNNRGQLGHGDTDSKSVPVRINGLGPVKAVAAAGYDYLRTWHSLALAENGAVYSWGGNALGQLGHGDTSDRSAPARINGLGPAKAVSSSGIHSLILLEDGSVLSFGSNNYGQLGHGDVQDRSIPVKINGLESARAVSASGLHSLVISGTMVTEEEHSQILIHPIQPAQPAQEPVSEPEPASGAMCAALDQMRFNNEEILQQQQIVQMPGYQQSADIQITGAGLRMQGGFWTNGLDSVTGLSDGNGIITNTKYIIANNTTFYTRFKVDGAGRYMAVLLAPYGISAGTYYNTNHSWAGGLLIPEDTWLYQRLTYNSDGSWSNVLAEENYDNQGGKVLHRQTGVLDQEQAALAGAGTAFYVSFGDNYGGENTSVVLWELMVTECLETGVAQPKQNEPVVSEKPAQPVDTVKDNNQQPRSDIAIYINGQLQTSPDKPVMVQNRTLLPMRALFQALGAEVTWRAETNTAVGIREGIEVRIPIGSTVPTVNGKPSAIDVPAQLINGRTYIPLRFVGEALGDDVKWDAAAGSVVITKREEIADASAPAAGFALDKEGTIYLSVGETVKVTAIIAGAENLPFEQSYPRWGISDVSIAQVSGEVMSGYNNVWGDVVERWITTADRAVNITGKSPGQATLSVTIGPYENNQAQTKQLTVIVQ